MQLCELGLGCPVAAPRRGYPNTLPSLLTKSSPAEANAAQHLYRLVPRDRRDLQIGERRLHEPLPEDVFDSLMLQRAMLKRDQQLAEWICC